MPDVTTDTQKTILEAAVTVFGRYGFRQASMDQIAEEAGLSRQAVYRYHFRTKEGLFEACVHALHADALAAGEQAAAERRRAGGSAAEVLASQLASRFGTILGRLHGSAHAGELVDENHKRCGAINREYEERFLRQLAATIRSERRAGRLTQPATPAPELARYLVAAARGIKSAIPPPSLEAFPRDLEAMVKLLVPDEEPRRTR